ncbi:hypothetical protein BJ165DRAFT_1322015, partial [Panaeolus papilionaceus]
TSSAWRHWSCVTPEDITHIKQEYLEPSQINGYDMLRSEDKERVQKAWVEGKVADEGI